VVVEMNQNILPMQVPGLFSKQSTAPI